jgi:hypothetical protein
VIHGGMRSRKSSKICGTPRSIVSRMSVNDHITAVTSVSSSRIEFISPSLLATTNSLSPVSPFLSQHSSSSPLFKPASLKSRSTDRNSLDFFSIACDFDRGECKPEDEEELRQLIPLDFSSRQHTDHPIETSSVRNDLAANPHSFYHNDYLFSPRTNQNHSFSLSIQSVNENSRKFFSLASAAGDNRNSTQFKSQTEEDSSAASGRMTPSIQFQNLSLRCISKDDNNFLV